MPNVFTLWAILLALFFTFIFVLYLCNCLFGECVCAYVLWCSVGIIRQMLGCIFPSILWDLEINFRLLVGLPASTLLNHFPSHLLEVIYGTGNLPVSLHSPREVLSYSSGLESQTQGTPRSLHGYWRSKHRFSCVWQAFFLLGYLSAHRPNGFFSF